MPVDTSSSIAILKASGLPGGGACAFAPANTVEAGARVKVTSSVKGERMATLGMKLGTIAHPYSGLIDLFAYKADK